MDNKAIKKQYLPIAVWRPLLILSIVIGHSFAIYSGSWSFQFGRGVDFIPAYDWVNPAFISFHLQAFFFISGYLFWMKGFVDETLSPVSYYKFLRKKFTRLYIPSIVFSLLYLYFFTSPIDERDLLEALVLGEGHLWFLPTIFWCFAIHRLFAKWGREHLWTYLLIAFLSIYVGTVISYLFPSLFTALLATIARYYFFFVLGASIRYTGIDRYLKNKWGGRITTYTIIFIIAFFVLWGMTMVDNWHLIGHDRIEKMLDFGLSPLSALAGTLAMYTIWLRMEQCKYSDKVARTWIYLSGICFGVYAVHQFILIDLVHNHLSVIQSLVGTWLVPFALIVIATTGSIAIVEAFKKVL